MAIFDSRMNKKLFVVSLILYYNDIWERHRGQTSRGQAHVQACMNGRKMPAKTIETLICI